MPTKDSSTTIEHALPDNVIQFPKSAVVTERQKMAEIKPDDAPLNSSAQEDSKSNVIEFPKNPDKAENGSGNAEPSEHSKIARRIAAHPDLKVLTAYEFIAVVNLVWAHHEREGGVDDAS